MAVASFPGCSGVRGNTSSPAGCSVFLGNLPGEEQRFAVFVYSDGVIAAGQHSAETPRGYFLTKLWAAVSEK